MESIFESEMYENKGMHDKNLVRLKLKMKVRGEREEEQESRNFDLEKKTNLNTKRGIEI